MKINAAHIEEIWGPRCDQYEEGCGCCEMWAMWDKVERLRGLLREWRSQGQVTKRLLYETDAALAGEGASDASGLRCEVIDGAIRIIVGAETVRLATDQHPDFYDGERQTVVVTDADEWLRGVHHHLTTESEDGSTMLSRMFDAAIADAVDRGEEGVEITPDKSGAVDCS